MTRAEDKKDVDLEAGQEVKVNFRVLQCRVEVKLNAQASNTVVAGILLVFSYEARVLIDPGATHSFVSLVFAIRLGRNPITLKCPLSVATFLSDNIDVDMVFLGSPMVVDGRILPADLVPLSVMDFDVILGMD